MSRPRKAFMRARRRKPNKKRFPIVRFVPSGMTLIVRVSGNWRRWTPTMWRLGQKAAQQTSPTARCSARHTIEQKEISNKRGSEKGTPINRERVGNDIELQKAPHGCEVLFVCRRSWIISRSDRRGCRECRYARWGGDRCGGSLYFVLCPFVLRQCPERIRRFWSRNYTRCCSSQ